MTYDILLTQVSEYVIIITVSQILHLFHCSPNLSHCDAVCFKYI